MHPELFTIYIGMSSWTVLSYLFFYMLAIIVVVCGTYLFAIHRKFERKPVFFALIGMTISGFLGARVLHVLTNLQYYLSGSGDIFSLHMEGFAISGGLISAILTGLSICKIFKIDFWKLGDTAVPFLGLGIAIARIGCFLNGCCFGKITDLPWGVKYPMMSQAHQYQLSHEIGNIFGTLAVHPTQLYEAFFAILGSILAACLIYKKITSGIAILTFGIIFSVFRLINMQLRVMTSTFDAPQFFYPIFYVCIVIVCGILMYIRIYKEH